MTDMQLKPCPTLEDTIIFVTSIHRGDVDKKGQPYILHVLRVCNGLGINATEEERIVALLHDTVEDHPDKVSLEILRTMGYTENIVQGVDSVTKRPEEKGDAGYFRAIQRVAENTLGRKVKIADLEDNTLPARNENPTEKDQKRLNKYKDSLLYLQRIELEYYRGKRHYAPLSTSLN